MADRTAAELFGDVFRLIRKHVPKKKRLEVALEYWDKAKGYDFDPYQMYCDATLIKLGLAKEVVDDRGEESVVYYDLDDPAWTGEDVEEDD
jgi:hypothetical protein